jgi:hypothetical protein
VKRGARNWARFGGLVILASAAACANGSGVQPKTQEDNGIFVDTPNVFSDKSLQTLLNGLANRLSQVSGIDQSSLIAHLGTTQGASLAQTQFSLQATTLPIPGVTAVTNNATPSIVQTTGNTANNSTPSTVQVSGQNSSTGPTGTTSTSNSSTTTTTVSNTSGASTQTVTTTPSNTTQTTSTQPTVSPTPAPLPSSPAVALPTSYSVSSGDLLNQQMQLSYQIINLQLLLQGPVDEDYTKSGLGKRHVTLGFPISIATPEGHEGEVAEVDVAVCNVRDSVDQSSPSLRTIIPREKTYNVASIVSNTAQLGVGAVIANVINVGASFLSGHQSYYLVGDQDTVALRRDASVTAVKCPGKNPAGPVTFAWQFRPVLDEKSVQAGLRQVFAQISIDPPSTTERGVLSVTTQTCWRNYHKKDGIVGKVKSCSPPIIKSDIQTFYDTVAVSGVTQTDNGDGTVTAKVMGAFPTGTRVGLGDAFLNDSSVGFDNTGTFIRFSTANQILATRGARLMSPDGLESDIVGPSFLSSSQRTDGSFDVTVHGYFSNVTGANIKGVGHVVLDRNGYGVTLHLPASEALDLEDNLVFTRSDGATCELPNGPSQKATATTKTYSDTLVEVTVPIWQCLEVHPDGGPYPLVAIVGGKAFGLSDAPFKSLTLKELTFLAPASVVQGQRRLMLKRLFLDSSYEAAYSLQPSSGLSVGNIVILDVSPKTTTFAITGSQLTKQALKFPKQATTELVGPALLEVTLTQDQLATVKDVVLGSGDQTLAPYPLPTVAKASSDNGPKISIIDSDKSGSGPATYAVTGADLKDATILFPKSVTPTSTSDSYLQFTLTADDLKTAKAVVIQPKTGNNDPIAVSLPSSKGDDASNTAVTLTLDKIGVPIGSTANYTIKGTNLQHVVDIEFGSENVPFGHDSNTSITIGQLPTDLVARANTYTLKIGLDDKSTQYFTVTVNKNN